MNARRFMLWTLPLWLVPPVSIATGIYLSEQQPPCPGGFIDGPCDDPAFDPFGLYVWLVWLGVLGLAVEALLLAGLLIRWYVRR